MSKIRGEKNPPDKLTKHLVRELLIFFMKYLGLEASDKRSPVASWMLDPTWIAAMTWGRSYGQDRQTPLVLQ